jgi:threonine/homoserine/homoserine lactone efflux protein
MTDPALYLFLASVVVISLSGVIVPGPLLAVTIAKAPEGPHTGVRVGLGHGIVEMPLVALIALGFGTLFRSPPFTLAVGLLGGAMLVYLGAGILKARGDLAAGSGNLPYRAVPSGALATLMNPYFFIWWATVGAALVVKAAAWGIAGLVLFGLVHWSCDLGWYWQVTAAIARGGSRAGRLPRVAYLCSGVLLVGFGLWFLWGAYGVWAASSSGAAR